MLCIISGGSCENEIHRKGLCHENSQQMGNAETSRGKTDL